MRDNKYLEKLLYDIWENHFCDIPRLNAVIIKYGKYSKRQLGSIKIVKEKDIVNRYIKRFNIDKNLLEEYSISVITITKYFSQLDIPEFVIRSTVAHELCHYAHGFNSPLKKVYAHPHRGNVIKKELAKRELLNIHSQSKEWLKQNWINTVT